MKDFQLFWNLFLEAPAERWDYKGVKVSVCLKKVELSVARRVSCGINYFWLINKFITGSFCDLFLI
jgi:hypothetical protein